jgi:hypothetical protein
MFALFCFILAVLASPFKSKSRMGWFLNQAKGPKNVDIDPVCTEN